MDSVTYDAYTKKLEQFLAIHKTAKDVVAADISWQDKYELIFDGEISTAARVLFSFIWFAPKTASFEESVKNYMEAFDKKAEAIQKVLSVRKL